MDLVVVCGLFLLLLVAQGNCSQATATGNWCPPIELRPPALQTNQVETECVRIFADQQPCEFIADPSKAPQPVLLVADGRTGSSVTWQLLSTLTGSANRLQEFPHRSPDTAHFYFKEVGMPDNFATQRLCHRQREFVERKNITSGFVAIQWKPASVTLNDEHGQAAYRDVGAQWSPDIPVVYLTRGKLRMFLSHAKHKASQGGLPPHCGKGDTACVEAMANVEGQQKYEILAGEELLSKLRHTDNDIRKMKKLFMSNGIRYIHVKYENLFDAPDADEWMRVFSFLGRGPSVGLTMDDVRKAAGFERTNAGTSLSECISNYDEVEATLTGTIYECLLEKELCAV